MRTQNLSLYHAESNAEPTAEISNLISSLDDLLGRKKLHEAYSLASMSTVQSPWVENAKGVCLLRLGKVLEAKDVFRRLVFKPAGMAIKTDAHPTFVSNYATALLVDGNDDGFHLILAGIRDRSHPSVSQLISSVKRWKQKMTWWERIRLFLGLSTPPLTLDFAPGHL